MGTMLTFATGFLCGAISTITIALLAFFVLDRVVRPPSGG